MTDVALTRTNTGIPGERLPEHASGARSLGWWGMVLLIATEATLFGLLIATYFYLRFRSGPVWPPDGIPKPELQLVLVMTAILWSSSLPVHLADRAIRKGGQGMLRAGLLIGSVLGFAFIALQFGMEYPHALEEFTPSSSVYGSLFFTITGFHGAHVIVGLAMSAWTQVRAWSGAFDEHRHVTVQNFAMYWHFVDVVWLFVLATIYLSPHL
ncbi:MAG TPA: cytochrome c oxidase subunit 3 [Actinomycetota bacterium]|jgi:heme/copper-type cytochrome/quinol oxidase subunit 3|nr:cytochrome c oxidase subunit 3 [Actinomycetota bacterium]